jgi:hypothetical protein
MKTHGPNTEQTIHGGGEDVLAGVLLHVIEATGPIDHPMDLLTHSWRDTSRRVVFTDHVRDAAILFVDNVDHPQGWPFRLRFASARLAGALAKDAGIKRLAA